MYAILYDGDCIFCELPKILHRVCAEFQRMLLAFSPKYDIIFLIIDDLSIKIEGVCAYNGSSTAREGKCDAGGNKRA